jgi:hypothetical protein
VSEESIPSLLGTSLQLQEEDLERGCDGTFFTNASYMRLREPKENSNRSAGEWLVTDVEDVSLKPSTRNVGFDDSETQNPHSALRWNSHPKE